MNLLQIATGITKCDDYYKLRQYKFITKCDGQLLQIATVDTLACNWWVRENLSTPLERGLKSLKKGLKKIRQKLAKIISSVKLQKFTVEVCMLWGQDCVPPSPPTPPPPNIKNEPARLSTPPKPLFSLKPREAQPGWGHCYLRSSYILWAVALLEACDVPKHVCHLGCHFWFYQELEISLGKNG